MTFDLEIMKKYFPYVDNNYGKHDEMHDLITIVENMRDQEKSNENEQIEQIQQIISKYDHDQEDSNQKEYFLESFKKTYHQEILTFLNKFIEQFELFLVSLDLKNYKDITESEVFMFFKVNAWSEFSKFRMSSIIENFEKKGLGIYMKNGFESNG